LNVIKFQRYTLSYIDVNLLVCINQSFNIGVNFAENIGIKDDHRYYISSYFN